ncbi:MAG: FGGY-family carbohydrate kinase [Candidatus Hydrogenedentota bacterium]
MRSGAQYVLAVDLGTSGCKTALVSIHGEVAGWEYEPVPTQLFNNGGAEQDPEAWWSAFLNTGQRLLAQGLIAPDQVVAVCCSTQGESTVAVDAEGQALRPCVLWMDTRGVNHLPGITRGRVNIGGFSPLRLIRWLRLTGGAPSLTGKDPAAHMLLIKHEFPGVYAETAKFLNVLDFMNLRLTGRCVATHDSILTSWVTDNRNPSCIVYSDVLVRNSGIPRDKFPDIVPCTEVLGTLRPEVANQLGLPRSVKVVAGSIDTAAAAVGSGAVGNYQAHLYIGTSSWLAAHVPFKKTAIFSAIASLPCAIPGRYLMTALQATAGGNLAFLRDKILYHKDELLIEERVPDVYKIMDRIAERTQPGSNGLIFTPWSHGERSPVENPYLRAAVHNLSLENSREDLIRAVLEGVAFNNRWLLGPVERFLGQRLKEITIAGGGANSDVWCQIFADVLNRPIRQLADPIQANVLGAAFIAFTGLGMCKFSDVPDIVRIKKIYHPRPETKATYEHQFREFLEIYRKTKGIYRRLNRAQNNRAQR